MKRCKLLLVVAVVTVLLGVLAASASARTFSMSNQTFRAMFRELKFEGAFGHTVCIVTLEGSLHSRTIAKVRGALVGYITRAGLGPCVVGRATILTETLPWHVRFDSFTGSLPNITTIKFSTDTHFRILSDVGEVCLLESTPESPAFLTFNVGAGGVLVSAMRSGTVPSRDCFFPGRLSSGNEVVTVLNSSTRITVKLI